MAAKTASVVVLEVIQAVVLVLVAIALGWTLQGNPGLAILAVVLATVGFSGLGLLMAGALRAEVTLAAANGLYLLLLLLGGMVFPLSKLPGGLRGFSSALPGGCSFRCPARLAGRRIQGPRAGLGRTGGMGDSGAAGRSGHVPVGVRQHRWE
jgi:hypothetical protein